MRFHFGLNRCHGPSGMGRGGDDRRERHDHGHRERWGFHRGEGRGPGGRTRMFEQGDLRFVILKLLSDKPAHGYEIIKLVEERFGGTYAPSPGIVYPTLTLLEEIGQIAVVQTDGARKLFDITDDGRTALEANRPTVDRIFARMEEMRQRMGGAPSPKIRRGMENVKTALRLRIERGPLSEADADRIAEALDAVAKAIEL